MFTSIVDVIIVCKDCCQYFVNSSSYGYRITVYISRLSLVTHSKCCNGLTTRYNSFFCVVIIVCMMFLKCSLSKFYLNKIWSSTIEASQSITVSGSEM